MVDDRPAMTSRGSPTRRRSSGPTGTNQRPHWNSSSFRKRAHLHRRPIISPLRFAYILFIITPSSVVVETFHFSAPFCRSLLIHLSSRLSVKSISASQVRQIQTHTHIYNHVAIPSVSTCPDLVVFVLRHQRRHHHYHHSSPIIASFLVVRCRCHGGSHSIRALPHGDRHETPRTSPTSTRTSTTTATTSTATTTLSRRRRMDGLSS
jgi:hypothetical protein